MKYLQHCWFYSLLAFKDFSLWIVPFQSHIYLVHLDHCLKESAEHKHYITLQYHLVPLTNCSSRSSSASSGVFRLANALLMLLIVEGRAMERDSLLPSGLSTGSAVLPESDRVLSLA